MKRKKIIVAITSIIFAINTISAAQDREEQESPHITVGNSVIITGQDPNPTRCAHCSEYAIIITPRKGIDFKKLLIRGYQVNPDTNVTEQRGTAPLAQLYASEKGALSAPLLDFYNYSTYEIKVQRVTFDKNNNPHLGNFIRADEAIEVRFAKPQEKIHLASSYPLSFRRPLTTSEKIKLGIALTVAVAWVAYNLYEAQNIIKGYRENERRKRKEKSFVEEKL